MKMLLAFFIIKMHWEGTEFEILSHSRQGPVYPTQSILGLLMTQWWQDINSHYIDLYLFFWTQYQKDQMISKIVKAVDKVTLCQMQWSSYWPLRRCWLHPKFWKMVTSINFLFQCMEPIFISNAFYISIQTFNLWQWHLPPCYRLFEDAYRKGPITPAPNLVVCLH